MIYDIPTLIKEAEERRWVPGWEELPKIGETVLAFCLDDQYRFLEIDRDEIETWWQGIGETSGNDWDLLFVKYWMPLPKLPEEE